MIKSLELNIIRIISGIILILSILSDKDVNVFYCMLFILCIIINNNLRIFYFKSKRLIYISLLSELIISTISYNLFGGIICFYLTGVIIDTFIIDNKNIRGVFIMLIASVIGFCYYEQGIYKVTANLLFLVLVILFLEYIRKLYKSSIESQKLYDKLRLSEEKILQANRELEFYNESVAELTLLKERNRISREIHDSVGHALTTTMIQLSAIESISYDNEVVKEMASSLRSFVNESFQDVKRAVNELKPEEYENYKGILRLQESCRNFEKLSGIKVKVIVSKEGFSLSYKQVHNLNRIIQEALSNALKHGKATEVRVYMNFNESEFILSINDNGQGVNEIKESGIGLKSIRERTEEINGTVYMESECGKGFFIRVVVPKDRREDNE